MVTGRTTNACAYHYLFGRHLPTLRSASGGRKRGFHQRTGLTRSPTDALGQWRDRPDRAGVPAPTAAARYRPIGAGVGAGRSVDWAATTEERRAMRCIDRAAEVQEVHRGVPSIPWTTARSGTRTSTSSRAGPGTGAPGSPRSSSRAACSSSGSLSVDTGLS